MPTVPERQPTVGRRLGWQSTITLDMGCAVESLTERLGNAWENAVEVSFEGTSVLIVEDDTDLLATLTTVIEQTGATTSTAVDGNEALDAVAETDPDIVILDAMLPKRSGFLVMEKLKGDGKKKGSKPFVIMITGNAGKRHQVFAESLGVDAYLNKPFRMAKLLECMDQVRSA